LTFIWLEIRTLNVSDDGWGYIIVACSTGYITVKVVVYVRPNGMTFSISYESRKVGLF